MKIDLADLARRARKTRQPRFVARAIVPTAAQEHGLLKIYMRVVRTWLSAWSTSIAPVYEKSLAAIVRDSVDDTQGSLDETTLALNRLVLTLDAELEDWAVRVEQWHRAQFGTLFTPVGVKLDTLLGRRDVQTSLEAVLADNASLIRSLNDQMRNGISGEVFRGLTNRTPARDVARQIRRVASVGKSRSELIAADQLQKLTSRLDQERQEQVGLDKFQWLHSGKKHPRPAHIARNGQIFAWSSEVAKTDPPGRAIRCGCKARPVLDFEETAADLAAASQPVATAKPRRVREPTTNEGRDKAARKFVLDNGRRDNVEYLSSFDALTGESYGTNRGGFDYCKFTPELERAARNPQARAIVHHNHPRSTSLSYPDIALLERPGIDTVWAHGNNGSAYKARKVADGPALTERFLRSEHEASYAKLAPLVSSGVVEVDAATKLHAHLTWLVLRERKQLEYDFTLAGDTAEFAKKYETIFRLLVESLA